MKLLSLSASDLSGGAAVAATRLHLGLKADGMDSTLIVGEKMGGDPDTIGLDNNLTFSLRRNLDLAPLKLDQAPESISYRSLSWLPNKKLERAIAARNPDLIHLHWTQNGFMPLSLLDKLTAPLVWTFHDLWPVCGALHHEYQNDLRYHEGYTAANRPRSRRGLDLDRRVALRKEKAYKEHNIEAIVPSHWMAEQVRKSSLWRDRPLTVIPIGLDTQIFKPLQKAAARDLLNLPADKKLILFGAMYAGSDKNKGYHQLREALEQLNLPKDEIELAVFGMSAPAEGESPLPYPAHWMGVLRDQFTLAALYSAADVMVVPSLQESFGQTASEALSCGTPVVAFDTSGLKDIVDHEQNGYLAEPFEPSDLAEGIRFVLADTARYETLCENAREKVVSTFSLPQVVKRHREVYEKHLA
ncbi:glycosyltransferase [Roseibacillus persicicus]|uniref:glycosyltransferase n=1 Tax=Roseibacillus persicicus TaxID=454148 RepID=UPI00280D0CA3|nr:glycosyltransferase [Roseibacillus persicicus]MDQ8189147.1 glycosyltransferase [Roseibacillus persicicus]